MADQGRGIGPELYFACHLDVEGEVGDMSEASETVVVLGASRNPERYSHKAVVALQEQGHRVLPLHPAGGELLGLPVLSSLEELDEAVDSISMYVRASLSDELEEAILALKPRRVIFNPGAENPSLAEKLKAAGIETEEHCTLVMLATGQF